MSDLDDRLALIDLSGTILPMTDGWHVSIRAELVDITPQKPHGLDYGLVLNDPRGRVLGFDNRHGYDGAPPEAPFDHEHVAGETGRAIRYDFASACQLLSDFFDRVEAFIAAHRIRTGRELRYLDGDPS